MPTILTDELVAEIEQRCGFAATPEEVAAARFEPTYATIKEVGAHYPAHVARYEHAAELLSAIPPGPVVDAAGGVGYGAVVLIEGLPYKGLSQVISVEKNRILQGFGEMHYWHPFVTRFVADLELLDWYWVVLSDLAGWVSIETLEHLRDPKPMLHKAQEVLRSDGLLIISTPHKPQGNPYHVHEYELAELEGLLDASGFEIVSEEVQRGTEFEPLDRTADLRGAFMFVVARRKP